MQDCWHIENWIRLCCHDFVDNQVRLQLFALAYNLGNFLRRLTLPREMKHCSLTTLLEKLVKIGAKVVKDSRYVIFQMAEVFVNGLLFRKILGRIDRLRYLGFTKVSNIRSVKQFVWRGGGR